MLSSLLAFSPIVENLVRLKNTGFDFDEKDFTFKEQNCLWVNLYLRYRNSRAIQDFCRNVGRSLREDISHKCLAFKSYMIIFITTIFVKYFLVIDPP